MSQLPLSPPANIVLLSAGLLVSALAVVASTHHVREGYARLQDLELRRWELQEQYTRLLLEVNTWAAPHRIIDLVAKRSDLLTVTQGAQWQRVPIIKALIDDDFPVLDTNSPPTLPRDPKGVLVLAQLRVALNEVARVVELRFMPILAHWAYHIVGEGAEVSEVYDPDGVVEFAALPSTTLPDGRPVTVLCSTRALPARARAPYRFTLQIPGPFGPQTLIPVLPAPGPDFVSLADPGSAAPRFQSNIYVSIA